MQGSYEFYRRRTIFLNKGSRMNKNFEGTKTQLTLTEIKQTELNILIAFDEYCRNNNLSYFLVGGTLIGAIRHKGFIPWDDDIDVMMPRNDYEKFKQLTYQNPIKETYITASYDSPDIKTVYPFIKIFDTNTEVIELNLPDQESGIWIDIFPVDSLPDDENTAKKMYKKNLFQKRIFRILTNKPSYTKNIAKKILLVLCKPIKLFIKTESFAKTMDSFAKSNKWNSTNNAGVILWGDGIQERFEKSMFETKTVADFEGHKFFVPEKYHEYLTQLYGDYMQLPPENERPTHNMVAYKLK